jgi:hypothetical protein
MLAIVAMMLGGIALAGCQLAPVEVPYNQRLVVQLRETSGENPVNAEVKLDGKTVFGPNDLAPGDRGSSPIRLHEPDLDAPKLSTGQTHRISWRLHRNGTLGKAGNAELTIFSGTKPIKTQWSSTTGVMPGFAVEWYVDIKLSQPPAAGATPAKAGATPSKTDARP